MVSIFFQGMALGAALILPLGPQNVFIMNQGIRRHYPLMTAGLCALSDIVLIGAGVFGGSALLAQSPLLLNLVTWGGVAFLLWYGWCALCAALNGDIPPKNAERLMPGRWRVVLTLVAVTWLNPHVYIDTFIVLGSLGGQLPHGERIWFALGCTLASLLWFFSLALLASWFSPRLQAPGTQRIINLLVGVVMWFIAAQLARQGSLFFN